MAYVRQKPGMVRATGVSIDMAIDLHAPAVFAAGLVVREILPSQLSQAGGVLG